MLRDVINSIYNEFLSYFVPKKQKYKITGQCNMCGKCCKEIRSAGMKDERDLKIMQFFLPWYKRFFITGYDDNGNVVLSCKYLSKEGKCTVYKLRPFLCRNYPAKSISFNGEMPEECGYKVEKPSFKDYLKETE